MHFGKLKPNEKKDIVIRVEGVQKAYNGGIGQNSIQSEDILETEKKLSFTIEEATNLRKINCEVNLRSNYFMNGALSEIFIVECPKDCDRTTVPIYGGNISEEKCSQAADNSASNCVYSEDSSICKAAIHCGVLNSMGGFIELKIDGEQPKFIGNSSFGIESKEKTAQVRSFSFVGERSAIFANYRENFNGSLLVNWAIHDSYHAQNKDKNSWSFYENQHNFFNADGIKEDIRAVKHTGVISTELPYHAASLIKKRDTEFANGLVKFNLMLYELEPVYVYLRYTDTENHIGLLINNKNNMNNFALFTKVQGSIKVYEVRNHPLELKRWYRFRAYLYSDSVKITMQEEKVRDHKELFNTKITTISRGTVAFGTNGNNLFYITGISVEPFTLAKTERDESSKRYTWDYILKKSKDLGKVKYWCKKTFRHSTEEYLRCQLPHFYCRYRCEEELPRETYGILSLSCSKDCVNQMKNLFNPESIVPKVAGEKDYIENEMVDFLPKSLPSFVPGIVMKVSNKSGDKFASIEYEDDLGNKLTDEVEFKDERLDKCGGKLRKRTDCTTSK